MTSNETPLTFAVRLRSHPKLSITSKAKMTSAVLAHAAYGGQLVESRFFDVSDEGREWLTGNAAAARALVTAAAKDGVRYEEVRKQTTVFTDVPYDDVIDFLGSYEFHKESSDGDRDRLVSYIKKRVRAGALLRWSVAVIGNGRDETEPRDMGGGVSVRMVKRARLGQKDTVLSDVADIKTLSSRRDETIDLTLDGPVPATHKEILALRQKQRPNQGLLLIYPIEPESNTGDKVGRRPLAAPTDDVVVGVTILFPEPRPGSQDSDVEYWSADLSNVAVEVEDDSVLEQDDESS
jgi:hypothetical protein